MKSVDFAQATGYLRVIEKRILTRDNLDRVFDAPNGDEALKMLTQMSEYDFSSIKQADYYESVLKAELKRVYDLAYAISPYSNVVDILSIKYDCHNLKTALKAKYLNQNYDYLFIGVTKTPANLIKDLVMTGATENVPEFIIKICGEAVELFENTKDPQLIDICVDKGQYVELIKLSEEIGNEFITEYVQNLIDFYNVKTLMRIKNMQKGIRFLQSALISGGTVETTLFEESYDKSLDTLSSTYFYKFFGNMFKKALESHEKNNNFSELERLFDNYLIEKIKLSKFISFGPEVLFSYVVAKENEIRQIRVLMTCKMNNIPFETLKERLRDNYA